MLEGLLGVLAVGLGLQLFAYLMQDSMVFMPQPLHASARARIAERFPAAQEIFLDAEDGHRLHAWHVRGEGPLVIYFGGNAEEVSWMIAQALARAPRASWLLVDYRGYGASDGAPSESVLAADALRWYDRMAKEEGKRGVYVFGRSLGSGVAVYLAAHRPVAGVILVAPFDSLTEVGSHHYPFLPVRWLLRHRFESVQHAPRLEAPLLCLVAERDSIIPLAHSKRLFDAWAGPKRWVMLPGAGHNSTDDSPLFWQSIRDFLAEGAGGHRKPG